MRRLEEGSGGGRRAGWSRPRAGQDAGGCKRRGKQVQIWYLNAEESKELGEEAGTHAHQAGGKLVAKL